ncbi:DUF2797 domain-containing protein [Hazenella sp. IB182357]|uniref:DUF2797 domain-containing protein n=1 Tax=Polycladospora coralii TaxID=2771432 RepID=A0A926RSV8_9BACL|nr:DUF2797 domain-containing protein [Polycladospora coralii]MBD1370798.1 DUF2797 domain-containing protein [Polycladospora coralii]
MIYSDYLTAMTYEIDDPIRYFLNRSIYLNDYIQQPITLTFQNEIRCIHCNRLIPKTYNSGSCYPCFKSLPQNDLCMVKPEQCHYHHGTCRDTTFGDSTCMQAHIVYLSLSSDMKVGITRKENRIKRWIDQGAVRAIPIMEVPTRLDSGVIESKLAQIIKDKTNWRKMLKNEYDDQIDLVAKRAEIIQHIPNSYRSFIIDQPHLYTFNFPHFNPPTKITSLSLDKQPEITGTLIGIKGQYLIFDKGVFNMRKHSGYRVHMRLGSD